jgi:hypothetical protein
MYARLSGWEQLLAPSKPQTLDRDEASFASNREDVISTFLIHQYMIRNMQRPRLRIFTFGLFAAGLTLLGIPAVLTFVQVTLLGISHLLLL